MKIWKVLALFLAVVLMFASVASAAVTGETADDLASEAVFEENTDDESATETDGSENEEDIIAADEAIEGESADDEGESEEGEAIDIDSDSVGVEGGFLTEATFERGDVPEEYLKMATQRGKVERVRIVISEDEDGKKVKSVLVYLPYGYEEEGNQRYNILYLLHASGGSAQNYFEMNTVTTFQCLVDNMIQNGDIEPLIIVAPNYYYSDSFSQYMPLAMQVSEISDYPTELTDLVIPAVEETYRTYAETTDEEGLRASRDHRGVAGFSLGATIAWYTFIQKMYAFRWFLPISEASWDDGNDGIEGIWDSDLSAQVLYDAVIEEGFTKDDFYLFVATGTDDDAFEIATEQMKSLFEHDDLFINGTNTSCSMMIGGVHTLSAIYTYAYHIFPILFSVTTAE